MTLQELERLKAVDIRTVDKGSLADINDIAVNPNTDKQKRLMQFIEKAQNPYCLMINGIAVKFVFAQNGCGLEDRLKGYLKGKME